MNIITWDKFEEIQEGDEWQAVTSETIVDQSRWHVLYNQVFQSPEGKFFRFDWRVGATEYQDNDEDINVVEVEPYEVTVTKYRAKK